MLLPKKLNAALDIPDFVSRIRSDVYDATGQFPTLYGGVLRNAYSKTIYKNRDIDIASAFPAYSMQEVIQRLQKKDYKLKLVTDFEMQRSGKGLLLFLEKETFKVDLTFQEKSPTPQRMCLTAFEANSGIAMGESLDELYVHPEFERCIRDHVYFHNSFEGGRTGLRAMRRYLRVLVNRGYHSYELRKDPLHPAYLA